MQHRQMQSTYSPEFKQVARAYRNARFAGEMDIEAYRAALKAHGTDDDASKKYVSYVIAEATRHPKFWEGFPSSDGP